MDHETLVRERIDAAKTFLEELLKRMPVDAAFWLREPEGVDFYLYVASQHVADHGIRASYAKVIETSAAVTDPNFDPFRVKLIDANDPMAKAAIAIYKRHPARIPTRYCGRLFGGTSVEEVYIYPPLTAEAAA